MVSTSRNKSCKILFCVGEIVFFYSEVFANGNHYWNHMKDNFFKKTSLLLVETVFLASEKQFSPFCRYFWLLKQFFGRVETVFFYSELFSSLWKSGVATFLKETLFLLLETDFLASGNVFLNKFFIPHGGDGFSVFSKPISLI